MLEIKGICVRRPRAQIPAPNDGVHRNGSDGFIKGAHCAHLNDDSKYPMFHGQVGFYWRTGEDTGLKVYYSIKHGSNAGKKWVASARSRMKKLAELGICPKPGKIVQVKVDLRYKDKVHKKKVVYALEVEHVHYPTTMEVYAHGYPYDFSSYEHPDHTPARYLRTKKKIDKTLRKLKMREIKYVGDSYKIGDVVWCCKKNKWMLVDAG